MFARKKQGTRQESMASNYAVHEKVTRQERKKERQQGCRQEINDARKTAKNSRQESCIAC